ncbi:MAG: pantetheine-phosphate adenylyltransferase [Candidatus Doudnabacteria bacterium]|nr:pantetheine-phosphate adenylyltransferase [Candidatus Doudnabacteria bacterium]
MTRAIFPGTFDPLHLGHMDVLVKAAKTFDTVIWGIFHNTQKNPKFTIDQRLEMMDAASRDIKRVQVQAFDGLLVDAAKKIQATHIVRSMRVGMDFDYEFPMTLINRKLAPELITVYFPAEQNHFHISSSIVRELIAYKQDLREYVPAEILEYVQ